RACDASERYDNWVREQLADSFATDVVNLGRAGTRHLYFEAFTTQSLRQQQRLSRDDAPSRVVAFIGIKRREGGGFLLCHSGCSPNSSPSAPRSIISTNLRNRYRASCGPGDASGWYCTEKVGCPLTASPSHVRSLRLMCVISARPRSDSTSTANPWFCA